MTNFEVIDDGADLFFLGGVEDTDMFPVRGQTVLIRAPWVKVGVGYGEKNGTVTYIIPRKSGDVEAFIPQPMGYADDAYRLY